MSKEQKLALLFGLLLAIPPPLLCFFFANKIEKVYLREAFRLSFLIPDLLVVLGFFVTPVWISRLIDGLLQRPWLCHLAASAANVIPYTIGTTKNITFVYGYASGVLICVTSLFASSQVRMAIRDKLTFCCAIAIWNVLLVYGNLEEALWLIIPWGLGYASKEALRIGEAREDVSLCTVAVTETKAVALPLMVNLFARLRGTPTEDVA